VRILYHHRGQPTDTMTTESASSRLPDFDSCEAETALPPSSSSAHVFNERNECFLSAFDARQHALLAESPGDDAPQKMAWLRAHQPVAYRELAAAVRHANIVLSQSPAAKMATAGWRDDEWACAVNCQLVGPFPSFEAVSSFIASHSESIHAEFKWRVGGPVETPSLDMFNCFKVDQSQSEQPGKFVPERSTGSAASTASPHSLSFGSSPASSPSSSTIRLQQESVQGALMKDMFSDRPSDNRPSVAIHLARQGKPFDTVQCLYDTGFEGAILLTSTDYMLLADFLDETTSRFVDASGKAFSAPTSSVIVWPIYAKAPPLSAVGSMETGKVTPIVMLPNKTYGIVGIKATLGVAEVSIDVRGIPTFCKPL
jgi:hypothetical protein